MRDPPTRSPHAALNPAGRWPKARKIQELMALSPVPGRPLRILEIGTGSGTIAHHFAARSGLDCEVDAVDVIDQRQIEDGYRFQQVDGIDLPFEDGTFDGVISNHVLEHVGEAPDQLGHLREIARVLRHGGTAYLASPNRWQLVEPHYRLAFLSWLPRRWRTPYLALSRKGKVYDCEPLRMAQLEAMMRAAGFEPRNLCVAALRYMATVERPASRPLRWLARLPDSMLHRMRRLCPTHIYLLKAQAGKPMMDSPPASRATVLVLASTYPRWKGDHEPGFVHELCKRLTDRFNVIVVGPHAAGAQREETMDGVRVLRYRYAPSRLETLVNDGGIVTNLRRSAWKWLLVPGFVLGQYLASRRLLKTCRIDVVHAHWLIPQGLVARRLKQVASVPYVVTSHGGDLFGLRGRLLAHLKRKVAADASAMTVVSTAMRDEAARIGLRSPRLDVLPMGVDLRQRFVADPNVQRAADELLFVGRLVPKKGLPWLLEALPAVLAQRPGVSLTIAGFGPEERALKARAQRLGIGDKVRFLGAMPQHELSALYRRASVFVAPFVRDDSGNQEGLPVVLMEAIGCGCPVVVGKVAGVHDLLGEAADEVCIDPTDTRAFADVLLATLDDPAGAQARARAIRQAAEHRVDWQVIANGYADVIDACLGATTKSTSSK